MEPGASIFASSDGLRSSPFFRPQDSKIAPARTVSGGLSVASSEFDRQTRKFGRSFGVWAAAAVSAAMSGGGVAGSAAALVAVAAAALVTTAFGPQADNEADASKKIEAGRTEVSRGGTRSALRRLVGRV